jgi:hypothetical protein
MQDYPDDLITVERPLDATQEEYEALKAALEIDPNEAEPTGWEVGYHEGKVYIFALSCSLWQYNTEAFDRLLGALIAKNGLDHLDFRGGCMGPVVSQDSRIYFRTMPDGSTQ